jgi:hypothetical protein
MDTSKALRGTELALNVRKWHSGTTHVKLRQSALLFRQAVDQWKLDPRETPTFVVCLAHIVWYVTAFSSMGQASSSIHVALLRMPRNNLVTVGGQGTWWYRLKRTWTSVCSSQSRLDCTDNVSTLCISAAFYLHFWSILWHCYSQMQATCCPEGVESTGSWWTESLCWGDQGEYFLFWYYALRLSQVSPLVVSIASSSWQLVAYRCYSRSAPHRGKQLPLRRRSLRVRVLVTCCIEKYLCYFRRHMDAVNRLVLIHFDSQFQVEFIAV